MFGCAKRTFRVHFFRKPDGPWLSLLNLHVVQQNPDIIDVEAAEEGGESAETEDYDDDNDAAGDDAAGDGGGWTVIEFGNSANKNVEYFGWPVGGEKNDLMEEKKKDGGRKIDERQNAAAGDRNAEKVDEDKKGVLINDQRPDVALFKDLILPWVPHRLRQHHFHSHLHHSHSDRRQNETLPEATTPKQSANAETTTTAANVKLHLEDILIFGAFVTPPSDEFEQIGETPTKVARIDNGTIGSADENGDLSIPISLTNDTLQYLSSQNASQAASAMATAAATVTTLTPINEEGLAMNLHVDPLGRDQQQLQTLLMIRSNDDSRNNASEETDEKRETYRGDLGGSFILPLLKERKYDNNSIPLVFPDVPLRVAISLEVLHLGNFDNFQMEYELDVLVRLRWVDVRLANNFSKPIRIREQKIIDRIWRPDAVFLNSKFSFFHIVTFPNLRMRIMPDGHVSFTTRITLLPDCQMNFCNFPHDTQRCSLYISSIAHPKSMLDFHWEPRPILFPRRVSLPDLRIKKIADTICQLPGKLIPSSCLALTFVLKRDSARYVAERYMPSILAMLFSWVAPYVPYNYEEVRIITPITVLLTLVQMEKGNQEVITSYLTSLDIWFVVIKAFTVLSLVESLAVMAYIKKGRAVESESQRAPNEYRRELLQAEVKRIERLYHRLDHLSMALSPLAFMLFMLYYVHFVAQRDGRSCVERHAEDGRLPL